MDEKLINAAEAMRVSSNAQNYELLAELADALEIDEVYVYNPDKIVVYSKSGRYLGWEAYEGHPVHDFAASDQELLIESIRKDTDSEFYYKYAYIRNPDGTFIQIGILADKVHELMEAFKLEHILEETTENSAIVQLFSLSSDFVITASTNEGSIGLQIEDQTIIDDLNNGRIHAYLNSAGDEDLYEIFVPLDYKLEKISAFGIQYSLKDVLPLVRDNKLRYFTGLIIVYLSLIYSMYTTYNRNKKLVQLAYYDPLTGLPNVESLKGQISKDLTNDKSNKGILLIECENLDFINLTIGYEYGHMVLKEVGKRLSMIKNPDIQLFRFIAQNYVLYIKSYKDKKELLTIISRANELLEEPFVINNITEHLRFKIGVMEYNSTDKSIDELLKDATIALNNVDSCDAINYKFFDEKMEQKIQREEIIEKEIRTAIMAGDTSTIYLVYQPIVELNTQRIVGFEALARMNSKEFGFVSPLEFIDIAERNQLIVPLSNYILRHACAYAAELVAMGYAHLRVAVNISAIHIMREDFTRDVLQIVKEAGIQGRNLELEVTESVLANNYNLINEKLRELMEEGINISLDDFGTGYSSFSRLRELNINTLKIDRSFIQSITDCNKDSHLTRDIVSIAQRLGLKTIAEGVEEQAHVDYLLEHGCDMCQGYLFSKPIPKEETIQLLKKHQGS